MDETLLKQAEDFYEANTALVDGLVAEIQAAGADESCLDELIHEGAEAASAPSEEASSVNNQGLAFQVACILQGNGPSEGADIVRRAAGATGPRA